MIDPAAVARTRPSGRRAGQDRQPAAIGIRQAPRTAPRRGASSSGPSRLGPEKPDRDAAEREPHEEVGSSPLAVDLAPGRPPPRPTDGHQPRPTRASASPPRGGGPRGSSSRRGPPPGPGRGRPDVNGDLVLGERVADRAGRAGAGARCPPSAAAGVERGGWSSSDDHRPIPRVRSVASGRTQTGRARR